MTPTQTIGIQDVGADGAAFRQVWRGFGSAVALIATEHEGRRHAMLASAVTSVSMEPPTLLVCVNQNASSHVALCARGAFSLGILPMQAREIAAYIATAVSEKRFGYGRWDRLPTTGRPTDALPWLTETQATLFCEIDQVIEYGTHSILISQVLQVVGDAGSRPLMYCNGRYGSFDGAES